MNRLGVIVPMVTPCNKYGKPDLTEVKSVCKYFVDAGCHEIFIVKSTGRGPCFTRNDRAKVCKSSKKQLGFKIPLFAGCIANRLNEMLENANLMADCGASAAVVTLLQVRFILIIIMQNWKRFLKFSGVRFR